MAVTTVEAKIEVAVLRRAETLPGGLPIAWPGGRTYDGGEFKLSEHAPEGKWIRVQHVPNTVERLPLYGTRKIHRFLGLLQVVIHWPKHTREIALREIGGQVVEHYPADFEMTEQDVTVRVMDRPRADQVMPDGEGIGVMLPVMIRYDFHLTT